MCYCITQLTNIISDIRIYIIYNNKATSVQYAKGNGNGSYNFSSQPATIWFATLNTA